MTFAETTNIILAFLQNTELMGYVAITFNLLALIQKKTLNTLILIFIASIIFILNMHILNLPKTPIIIVYIGLFLTGISILLINRREERNIIIKISPLIALAVVFINGVDTVGILSGIGFLFATIAKLQSEIIKMKYYLLLSAIIWFSVMFLLHHISFMIFYLQGALVLSYSIWKILRTEANS